ncbi:hypothetical protein K2173_017480 [Erythroxylum novogranatense]|uniref:Uncharacterized protein n=1 Tax=Erythroxylum novogranatense TaxID=1862640 RepID=A0AAV8TKP8_9ROSI|nr:hypothetical protein K2173_017480 [Erythroxylum novogranatense]
MQHFSCFREKLALVRDVPSDVAGWFRRTCQSLTFQSIFNFMVLQVKPLWIQLTYFVALSLVGYFALKVSKPKEGSLRPKDLDTLFTSVSAATVSSMSTVEMEDFSNSQLIILTILIFSGSEVFTSMLGLLFRSTKFSERQSCFETRTTLPIKNPSKTSHHERSLELVSANYLGLDNKNRVSTDNQLESDSDTLKLSSVKCLGYVVLAYLLVVHLVGSTLVVSYLSANPSAKGVITLKGINKLIFSVFTTVSTFTNCGFVPTNENMIVFRKNSGLLLLLIPQVLLGNTLYAPSLRFLLWVLEKLTKQVKFKHILMNTREIGYDHLLSGLRSSFLVATVLGFIFLQLAVFCSMEWNSEAMKGLSGYEKFVSSLFQVVNSRHAGESVFDISTVSPAILVLFVVMMYLPPYTTYFPEKEEEKWSLETGGKQRKRESRIKNFVVEWLLFSQLSYLAIFVILISITEREKMKNDPLNFNVLNVTLEVVSAYGNVGLTTGYSCKRQLVVDSSCKDAWYGFVGRWSNEGKMILIIVMFFGRLKKFSLRTGKAWKLS